jgi:hypothetical protein
MEETGTSEAWREKDHGGFEKLCTKRSRIRQEGIP